MSTPFNAIIRHSSIVCPIGVSICGGGALARRQDRAGELSVEDGGTMGKLKRSSPICLYVKGVHPVSFLCDGTRQIADRNLPRRSPETSFSLQQHKLNHIPRLRLFRTFTPITPQTEFTLIYTLAHQFPSMQIITSSFNHIFLHLFQRFSPRTPARPITF
jgi:hypothetical protein